MLIDGLVQINGTIAIRNSLYERNSSTMKIYMLGTGLMGTIFYWWRDSFLDISHIGKILVIVQLFIFSSFIVYIQISENGQRKRAK